MLSLFCIPAGHVERGFEVAALFAMNFPLRIKMYPSLKDVGQVIDANTIRIINSMQLLFFLMVFFPPKFLHMEQYHKILVMDKWLRSFPCLDMLTKKTLPSA